LGGWGVKKKGEVRQVPCPWGGEDKGLKRKTIRFSIYGRFAGKQPLCTVGYNIGKNEKRGQKERKAEKKGKRGKKGPKFFIQRLANDNT